MLGLSCCTLAFSVVERGLRSNFSVQASYCGGFSHCGPRALDGRASVLRAHGLRRPGSRGLERRFSSCGVQALLSDGMWGLPGPGIQPVFPALQCGFLTPGPLGKSYISNLDFSHFF